MKIDTQFIKTTVHYVLAEQLAHRRLTPEAIADLALELVLTLTAANESTCLAASSGVRQSGYSCIAASTMVPHFSHW